MTYTGCSSVGGERGAGFWIYFEEFPGGLDICRT